MTTFRRFANFFQNYWISIKVIHIKHCLQFRIFLQCKQSFLSQFPRLGWGMRRVFLVCLSCFGNLFCYENIEHLILSKRNIMFGKLVGEHWQKTFVKLSGFHLLRGWGSLSESVKKWKFTLKIFFQIMLNEVLKICEK